LRRFIRLGTVISTNDRNWETAPTEELLDEFGAYRAIAVDMEGGAVAANGYRYRVHHGSFLCVSAKPLHGSVRIRQLQDNFYVRQSGRHLEIAIGAIRWLEYNFESALLLQYSRELRGSDDPPWD
jgi:AMP nucleosidase